MSDSVYLIRLDQMFNSFGGWGAMRDEMRRRGLEYHAYRCPFDLLREFDEWFEWHRRVYFEHESTGKVTVNMVADESELLKFRIERVPFFVDRSDMVIVEPRRMMVMSNV